MGSLHAKCENCWDPIPCSCPAQSERTGFRDPGRKRINGQWCYWSLSHGWETLAEIDARELKALAVIEAARKCQSFTPREDAHWMCSVCGGVNEDHPGLW
jgi:hypothetical protein